MTFLLFPPLAAGTLFANPESKYASPTRFVSGLTVGEKVSVFGLYESLESLGQTVRELLDADLRYTVCCDG